MAFLKGIVMQQLRKTAWNDSDALKIGQIGIKLAADSKTVLEVRIGTVEETWAKGQKIALESYFSNYATKAELSDHVTNHTNLGFTVATYKNSAFSNKDYTYDAISGNVPVAETLADTLYVENKITVATTPLSNRIKTIEDLNISEDYATKEYVDDAEEDAIGAANTYADQNFVKASNLATAVGSTINEALTHLNTLSVSVDGAAAKVYDPDPEIINGLTTLDLVSRTTHTSDLNGKETAGVAAGLVNTHNSSATAHTDIRTRITSLEEAIGATSNIMNFRGVYASLEAANTALTTKEYGDVIVITDGKEYVWAKDTTITTPETGKWYELGDTSVNAAAISALQSSLSTLNSEVNEQLMAEVWPTTNGQIDTAGSSRIDTNESNISTLQTAVTKLNGVEGTTGSVKATAKSYADAAKSAVLGTSGDAATANTVYGAKAAAAAAQSTANSVATTASVAREAAGYAVEEIWGNTPSSWNETSRIDNLESTRLTAVNAGIGISVNNSTALQPEVSLEAVSGLTASANYEFCVFKVDQYGRIIAKEAITVLDGNA